ncbi:MAG: DUF2909 domain-containing protein [Pseudomonadales bacterium]|nr:DUF2909 domain-containing protein [Pseudomonadales bacterium]|tara:strand:+ start:587 stop:772 length:186 start_codon:yes stop_codon:yes gene_type:complete
MLDLLIILVLVGIVAALGSALFFFVRDGGTRDRMVISLGIRAALGVLILVLLAIGFMYNLR